MALDHWLEKWGFILENAEGLAQAGAVVALKQLDELVPHSLPPNDKE
ncbi:MAG: hypothetical protein ACREBS_02235 [Nitrososphaerales archaeon]